MRLIPLLFTPARKRGRLRALGTLAGCLLVCASGSRADQPQSTPADSNATVPSKATVSSKATTPSKANKLAKPRPATAPVPVARSQRAEMWYAARFGIDHMQVRSVSSGQSIEFRYRVLDADKAAVLTDRNAAPYLTDEQTGTKLQVPVVEKIGALRQTSTPQVGKEYWMMFNNPGKVVKPGRRVDVTCGTVHIHGLTVE